MGCIYREFRWLLGFLPWVGCPGTEVPGYQPGRVPQLPVCPFNILSLSYMPSAPICCFSLARLRRTLFIDDTCKSNQNQTKWQCLLKTRPLCLKSPSQHNHPLKEQPLTHLKKQLPTIIGHVGHDGQNDSHHFGHGN